MNTSFVECYDDDFYNFTGINFEMCKDITTNDQKNNVTHDNNNKNDVISTITEISAKEEKTEQTTDQLEDKHCILSRQTNQEIISDENIAAQIASILANNKNQYCDITDYLTLPQSQAAKKIQMRPSTFSKRWKIATGGRKWPCRQVKKIDKEIRDLVHNVRRENGTFPQEIELRVVELIKLRQKQLVPVVIRLQ
jgi:hypothetical protein